MEIIDKKPLLEVSAKNQKKNEDIAQQHSNEKNKNDETHISININDSVDQKQLDQLVEEEEKTSINFKSFQILKILGSGSFGKVYLVKKKDNGNLYAMKALKKRTLILKKQLRYAITEANILKAARHPFIVGLHFAFQTPQYLYLVMDYCPGMDLGLHLAQRITFSENESKFYIGELILALEHLHALNVCYRDMKPENILLSQDGHIKLADFGLAKQGVGISDKTFSFCGSPAYLSPEMLKAKGVGQSADIYGIGAVLYEFLTGEPPFYHDDIPTMYQQIIEGELHFPDNISDPAKDLIKRLLNRDNEQRIGVQDKNEIKCHQFFNQLDWNKLLNKQYKPPILENLNIDFSPDKVNYADFDYDKENQRINRVINFTFIAEQE